MDYTLLKVGDTWIVTNNNGEVIKSTPNESKAKKVYKYLSKGGK
jgi:hypothetical protein